MPMFMFPGQGSQRRGMGGDLFDSISEYRSIEEQVDELLGYSLRNLCLEDTEGRLKLTQYTQPALYVVNALHYYKARADGITPTALAGHSLGEYNALLAADVFDLLTGLRLVKKRGELMGEIRDGAMVAVAGLDSAKIVSVLRGEGLMGIDVANLNSPMQIVISGQKDELELATRPLERAGATMCIPLLVSAAFHSRYMAPAADAFRAFLSEMDFKAPKLTVIANVTGRPYPTGNPNATMKSLLVKQIVQPVRWAHTIRYLQSTGIDSFLEVGPGNVLTKLSQQILKA